MGKWIQRKAVETPDKYEDDIAVKLAKIRGIKDLDEFLNPSPSSLYDPFLLNNMGKAIKIILDAVSGKKRVRILADIDCDGCCSTSIMYNYLKALNADVQYFHAQRSEGHGIGQAIDLVPEDTELLLIVDSSTSDAEACQKLSERGFEILILDHHLPEQDNPYATIVNPQLCDYPNKFLSGAGVCWQVIRAIDDTLGYNAADYFIDLAGVGIYADSMDMSIKENRYIVNEALNHINNEGLKALFKVAKKDLYDLKSTDIGFTIAPMINGASRMDKIELVLELMTTDDVERCKELAKEVNKLNNQRKKLQKEFSAKLQEEVGKTPNSKVLIFIEDGIGKGFAGLVANELANTYQRPVMVLSGEESKSLYQGSFRSYEGFKLKSFLSSLPNDLVIYTAGHEGAGGIGIPKQRLPEFQQLVNDMLQDVKFDSALVYDLQLNADEIDEDLIKRVEGFTHICGMGMPEATFKVDDLFIMSGDLIGKNKDTIKIECDNDIFLMKFRTDEEYYEKFPTYKTISVVGTLNLNKWMNWKLKKRQITKQVFINDYLET